MLGGGPNNRRQIICQHCGKWFAAHRTNPTTCNGKFVSMGVFCCRLCQQQHRKGKPSTSTMLDNDWSVMVLVGKHQFIAFNSGVEELIRDETI